jgi:hypothetical protein
MGGEVDNVGEQHRHLWGGVGDHLLLLLEPLGDGRRQHVAQQSLGPGPLRLEEPIRAAQCAAAVDRVAQQQRRQLQRGVPQQIAEHR